MHVSIHENECQNKNIVGCNDWQDSVHAVPKFIGIVKYHIYRISSSGERPTVLDGNYLAF